ncbi:hypothetical protein V8D89_009118 [Ganoderma adspersum]
MPTATTTTLASSVISLKASHTTQATSSTATTLRSLYPRAARAFLQRDVALTHSLLTSAFALLQPPASLATQIDALTSSRRKWDILRITFETTLFSSPPSRHDPERLPPSLRANLMLSPESLIATLHSRSLQLFTPSDHSHRPSSSFLPAQILVTLVLSGLKLDSPEVARGMIEDWLAKHGQEIDAGDPKGYAKVLELYCLHVLPRLQDWEYAEDFLTYERELSPDVRQQYIQSLRLLRAEAATASRILATLPDPSSASSSSSSTPVRSRSPAQSDSSASSSSTHTATPNGHGLSSLRPLTPSHAAASKSGDTRYTQPPHSASTSSIASTATSRTVTPHNADRSRERTAAAGKTRDRSGGPRTHANGHGAAKSRSRSHSATPARPGSRSVVRRTSFGPPSTEGAGTGPSTLALIRASLKGVLQGMPRSRLLLYVVLFVVVPIVSFVFRLRRKRARAAAGAITGANSASSTVDAVRRRLRGIDGQGNVVGKLWEEVAKAVMDTVSMAGRGLV